MALFVPLPGIKALEQKGVSGEQAIVLDLSRANAIAGRDMERRGSGTSPR